MGLKPTTFELEVQHANPLYYGGYAEKHKIFYHLLILENYNLEKFGNHQIKSDDASVWNIKYDNTEFLLLGTRK